MNNWPIKKMAEITRLVTDGKHGDCKNEAESGYYFLSSKDLKDGKLHYDRPRQITYSCFLETHRRTNLEPGDILLANCGASIGRVGIAQNDPKVYKTTFQKSISVIKADNSVVNSKYLYYFLLCNSKLLISLGGGAAQPNLLIGDIKKIGVPIPPFFVQSRIASILAAYDDLIENNARRIVILEEMARRIYEEWFVHFRFPGHEQAKMVESELGLVPEGWILCRLEDVCSRITDGAHTSPKSTEFGKPMASVKDMTDWGINLSSCRFVAESDYEKLVKNDCKPRLNDVLIAKDGSYLKHTFVVDEEIDLVILSSIAILRPNGIFYPNQLALYLRLPQIKERMKGYVSGVAVPRIILKDFRQFLILLPPQELQKRWADNCDSMLSLCRNLVRKNNNLRVTRDLLLPKLISGELDVSSLPNMESEAA